MQVFVRNNGFESNLADVRNFSLGDPNVICRILSDYLYSNKIGSIVRELSANAVDAHRLSGRMDKPFAVHVPGSGEGLFDGSDSDFSIRDYGNGLSEQDIYDLYTSYGASSKREDSSQIGGFGIGSKSPFAYTKAFEVVSWHGGTMSQYICFQDEGGSPCVKKLYEEESAEPSGIMVRFAVDDENDRRRFRAECQFQYAWFSPKPSCNISVPEIKVVYENEYGVCCSSASLAQIAGMMPGGRYSSGEYHALVNGCVYGLGDMYSRRVYPASGHYSMLFDDCWCFLKIDGAAVDISASREELAFTDRTAETVKTAYSAFIAKACREVWDEMHADAERSLFEATWKWRNKKVSAAAIAAWAKQEGISSSKWDFAQMGQLALQYVPLDASVLWGFLCGSVKGYETSRKTTSGGGLFALSKMTKETVDKDSGQRKTVPNFRRIEFVERLSESSLNVKTEMSLHLSGCDDFRLCFVKKGTKFSDIRTMADAFSQNLGYGGIVHVYAVSCDEEKNAVVEAYGCPDDSRIFWLQGEVCSVKTSSVRRSGSGKRELVRTKVSSLSSTASLYGSGELLYKLRMNAKEEWLSVEAIQKKLDGIGVLLVLDGTELSGQYPSTFTTFLHFVSRVSVRNAIPYDWLIMNEASYRKYLALGGRKMEEDDALDAAQKFLARINVEPEEYHHWALSAAMEDALKFEAVNGACNFLSAAKGHEDNPYVKAFSRWKRVNDIVVRNFSVSKTLAEFLFGQKERLCSRETASKMRNLTSAEMKISEIYDWMDKNSVLNLLRLKYSNTAEMDAVTNIIRKYLVW